jgi:hypothetical protein
MGPSRCRLRTLACSTAFRNPHPTGATALVLSPFELLERLAVFVPPPRLHRHRYHGGLAPNAKVGARVIALGRERLPEPAPSHVASPGRGTEPSSPCSHARQILEHLGLAARPPPLVPARQPPQSELGVDQTPVFDPTQPEPVPAYNFDQSVPDEFD